MFPLLQERPPRVLAFATTCRALEGLLQSQYTRTSIARALKGYTLSPEYRAEIKEGAPLHDLNGNVVGHVTAEQVARKQTGKQPLQAPPLLGVLAERFPALFNLVDPQPLPSGTYKLLLKTLAGECLPGDLAAALQFYSHDLRQQVAAARRETSLGTIADTGELPQAEPAGVSLVKTFATRYPACFGTTPPRPLAHGLRNLLQSELRAEFSRTSISHAYQRLCLRPEYLQVLVEGAPRYNLAGQIEGVVSREEADEAHSLLTDPVYREAFVRCIREGRPLNPWQRERLLNALESSELSTEEFARRYRLPAAGVTAQHNLGARERKLKRDARQNIVAAFRASGLSETAFCSQTAIKPKILRRALESVEADRITAALAASVAAGKHAPLTLDAGRAPAAQGRRDQQPQPAVTVRRRRRIDVAEGAEPLARAPRQ